MKLPTLHGIKNFTAALQKTTTCPLYTYEYLTMEVQRIILPLKRQELCIQMIWRHIPEEFNLQQLQGSYI